MISKKRFLLYLNPAVLLMLWISKKKKGPRFPEGKEDVAVFKLPDKFSHQLFTYSIVLMAGKPNPEVQFIL